MNLIRKDTISLDLIRKPVETELRVFDGFFREAMQSKIGLVDLIARYIIRQKGKRLRPILVFLSAQLCGGTNERTYRGATLVEILHTATLVHDDVVDDADTRRGLASINAVWKNKVAVLMGDYLLSRGLLLALEHKEYFFLHSTSRAVRRMSEGELLQIQRSRQLDMDEETYLRVIGDKTASLFTTCTEIGAASATEDEELRNRMASYGENVGMAFQIKDDLLDYQGRRSIIGKPTGLDLKEKKLTLPMIYALRHGQPKDVRQVLKFVKGGARNKELARQSLLPFPGSPAKEALLSFVDFVMQRSS
jgi:octaprenyl-diphosphate synthase